jgi:hypothetical protein
MSEFTPNTDEVRYNYAFCIGVYSESKAAEFDRWLAEHDAEVAKVERVWILALLEGKQDWAVSDVLALIKGGDE